MRLRNVAISAFTALAMAAGLSGAAASQQAPTAVGASLFDAKCKTCHDPAVDRAPSRDALAQRTPESVVQTLTTGSMSFIAAGLTPDMIRQLAVYVTGKPLASGPGAAASAGTQPADNKCAANPPIKAAATDWNGYGKTATSNRFQTNTTLTAGNVDRLKVKWSFSLAGGRAGQPTVIGDRMFFVTFAGDAYSLDAKTGCVYWRQHLGSPMRQSPLVVHRPGMSPSGWVMFVGGLTRDFRALDAMTGAEIWKTNLHPHPLSGLTGSPVISGDRIYVPVSSSEELTGATPGYSCCNFAGVVNALDIKTGKVVWRTQLLDPKPTRKNSAGTQLYGPAGSAVWSQPTVDARRGQLYVTTSDSYTEVDAPTSDAVVAIGLADGKIRWVRQTLKGDNFLIGCGGAKPGANCPLGALGPDVDYGSSPILFTLPSGKQVIMAGQKSGAVYGIDPDTGKELWANKVGMGSLFGGVEWGMAADNKALYVGISDGATPRAEARPGVYALNPANGAFIWKTPAPTVPCGWGRVRCNPAQSAPPTVIPGVVFSGGQDGWLRAYASGTGRTLWAFDTAGRTYQTVNGVAAQPGGAIDHTGFVVSGGMMFAISGYNGSTGTYAGNPLNVLLAFSIDGK